MSEIKARYVGGSLTGVDLAVPFEDGDRVPIHVAHGGELPAELPDGRKVPASFRDSLLEQGDNWTRVKRSSGNDKAATAEKDGEK